MPDWVEDESIWERAKEAARKTYKESDEAFWPVVASVYFKMGGKKGKSKSKASEASAGAPADTIRAAWSDAAREAALASKRAHAHTEAAGEDHAAHGTAASSHLEANRLHFAAHEQARAEGKDKEAGEHMSKAEEHWGHFIRHHEISVGLKPRLSMAASEPAVGEVKAADGVALDFRSLANAAASVQVAHWAADTVGNAHEALGALYADTARLVDALAECYAGRTKVLPVGAADPGEAVRGVLAVVEKARASVPEDAEDLKNILADMEAAANKAKYLLKAMDESGKETVQGANDNLMSNENAIKCRAAAGVRLEASEPWVAQEPVQFVYAPEGVHTITAGFRKDETITICVVVDEQTVPALQESFDHLTATMPKQEPYADEDHESKKATLRFPAGATKFSWGVVRGEPGVLVAGCYPTSYGAEAVNGKVYRAWSPEFSTDAEMDKAKCVKGHWTFPDGVRGSESNPARLVEVNFVVGALTNRPAFRAMPPVKAKQAEAAGDTVKAVGTSDGAKKGWERRQHHLAEVGFNVGHEKSQISMRSGDEEKLRSHLKDIHESLGEKGYKTSRITPKFWSQSHGFNADHPEHGHISVVGQAGLGDPPTRYSIYAEHLKEEETTKATDIALSSCIRAKWSDAARAAALEARQRNLQGHDAFEFTPEHLEAMGRYHEAMGEHHEEQHRLNAGNLVDQGRHREAIELHDLAAYHYQKAAKHLRSGQQDRASRYLQSAERQSMMADDASGVSATDAAAGLSDAVKATWSDAARQAAARAKKEHGHLEGMGFQEAHDDLTKRGFYSEGGVTSPGKSYRIYNNFRNYPVRLHVKDGKVHKVESGISRSPADLGAEAAKKDDMMKTHDSTALDVLRASHEAALDLLEPRRREVRAALDGVRPNANLPPPPPPPPPDEPAEPTDAASALDYIGASRTCPKRVREREEALAAVREATARDTAALKAAGEVKATWSDAARDAAAEARRQHSQHNLADEESWNMFGPGTGAHDQSAHSFQKEVPGGNLKGGVVQYNIDPLPHRKGFVLKSAGHPGSPGLWQEHGTFNTHKQAMKAAHEHYHSTVTSKSTGGGSQAAPPEVYGL